MATAKHRAIDTLRRRVRSRADKHAAIEREAEIDLEVFDDADVERLDDEIGDDLLRLIFIACHPVLSTEARVALTLRLLGGLTTDEIARAFLVPEPTIAQRIVRAKRTLGEARVPFELPRKRGARRAARVGARGDLPDLQRGLLRDRRRRLDAARRSARTRCGSARVLAGLAPDEPEVHGLVALLEIQQSRASARTDSSGRADPVARSGSRALGPALDPPRAAKRSSVPNGSRTGRPGLYALQAAIAACHARAATAERDRLAADRGALRHARGARAVADRRAQPRGRGVHGGGSGSRARARRQARRRARIARLSSVAERARRAAREGSAGSPRPHRSSSAPRSSPATSGSASCYSRERARAARDNSTNT